MKKILLLGGSSQQIAAIETAKRLGYHTVLCDFLTDNPGQYHADKFYLVSTTDKNAVLDVAKKENIDGVLAYASDPAAPTAAYVAERLGLPGNPLESVETLCNKDRFRAFLKANHFSVPESMAFSDYESFSGNEKHFQLPVIVKPVDSSGSKGVTVLRFWQGIEEAIEFALSFSRCGRFIVEEFIEKKHPYLIGGDIFVKDGQVILWGLMNCHRDPAVNPLVPVGKSYPPVVSDADLNRVKETLQRLVTALHIRDCGMNVEVIIDQKDRVFLIDIGPRNGGNMIPELLSMIFDVDVVEMAVRSAMGEPLTVPPTVGKPYYATHNLHAAKSGTFQEIRFSPNLESHIIRKEIYKKPGDFFSCFDNAAKALGILFLKYDSEKEMLKSLNHIADEIEIEDDSE